MGPQIVIRITVEGRQPPEIIATTEAEQKVAEELLARVRPVLDVIDALLGKGPKGL